MPLKRSESSLRSSDASGCHDDEVQVQHGSVEKELLQPACMCKCAGAADRGDGREVGIRRSVQTVLGKTCEMGTRARGSHACNLAGGGVQWEGSESEGRAGLPGSGRPSGIRM